MATCLGGCSFGLLSVSFVNVYQFVCFLSLLVLRVGFNCIRSFRFTLKFLCLIIFLAINCNQTM